MHVHKLKQVEEIKDFRPKKVPHMLKVVQEERLSKMHKEYTLKSKMRDDYNFSGPRCPEDLEFSASLRALVDYLGEDMGYRILESMNWRLDKSFIYLMGVTGEAFSAPMTPEPAKSYERAMKAIGYDYKLYFSQREDSYVHGEHFESGLRDDIEFYEGKGKIRDLIVTHISEKESPVIVMGLLDAPQGCVVVGYKDYGETLMGWNFPSTYSTNNTPTYIEVSHWYEKSYGVLLVMDKEEKLNYKEGYSLAFYDAIDYLKNEEGLKEWKKVLADQTMDMDDKMTEELFFKAVNPITWDYAERRWYAARFAEQAIEYLEEYKDILEKIMKCCDQQHNYMYEMASLIEHSPGHHMNKELLADENIRKKMIRVIDQCRELDQDVVELLKKMK
ncbi:hypothetical protein [Vallitalea okinawensis]|uniref:hypothetical protein n=1 Tax=Vallitalea okinawensis TaxID=2078660 RepID=UPI000CFC5C4B|nr:hypothetical protein [Vallitalea okinawensis]